jgi:hypothetical protein
MGGLSMTRFFRWSTVVFPVMAVVALSTPVLADAAGGGQGDESGIPAGLVTLDYEPFVLTLDDVRAISGLAEGEPYTTEETTAILGGVTGGTDVPAVCGEFAATFGSGASGSINGAGASGAEVLLSNSIGFVAGAKNTLADLKSLAKDCDAPYTDGRFVPAAEQPTVKKVGDGVVAFAATPSAPPEATIYQLYVRDGKYFISSLLVAIEGTDGLTRSDLARLAKRMASHLADLEREYRRS